MAAKKKAKKPIATCPWGNHGGHPSEIAPWQEDAIPPELRVRPAGWSLYRDAGCGRLWYQEPGGLSGHCDVLIVGRRQTHPWQRVDSPIRWVNWALGEPPNRDAWQACVDQCTVRVRVYGEIQGGDGFGLSIHRFPNGAVVVGLSNGFEMVAPGGGTVGDHLRVNGFPVVGP